MSDERGLDEMTLERVEDDHWGDPPADATTLMRSVYRARRTPLGSLSAEELRLLIAQKVGLDVILPRALARLECDPMLEGDYYPGDVLAAVLRVPPTYWSANPERLARIRALLGAVSPDDPDLKADIDAFQRGATRR